MVNYANGKIYKIECLTTGLIYVGSTTKERLSQRMVEHRSQHKAYKNGKYHYVSCFNILENDNYRIDLIEAVNVNNKDELRAREGHYIRILECVNKRIENRTPKEYQEANKDKKEYDKKYREKNADKIKKHKYAKHTCECGSQYFYCTRARHFRTTKHQNFINSQI